MADRMQSVPLTQVPAGELCKVTIHTFLPGQATTCSEPTVDTFIGDDYKLEPIENGIRWIHLPVNNMVWAEKCVGKVDPFCRMRQEHWISSVRPAFSETTVVPLHSRRMELKCRWQNEDITESAELRSPLFTVYLPYMNWDECRQYRALAKVYEHFQSGKPLKHSQGFASEREAIERTTSQFLRPRDGRSLHPRRRLEQFYYSSMDDPTHGDRSQTVSKWTGSNVSNDSTPPSAPNSLLIMVDQLWCWVVDERTVVSCFPSHNAHYQSQGTRTIRDLYGSIRSIVDHVDHTTTTVWTLHSLIVEQAVTHLHSQWNRSLIDYIEVYRWTTSQKTGYQATLFKNFNRDYSNGGASFDDEQEMKLTLEITDIIDELKMLKSLLGKQVIAVESIRSGMNEKLLEVVGVGQAVGNIARAEQHLGSALSNVNEIKAEAEETYRSLMELLDLKSKTASLAEARETTKQGQAVMLFTIVTIIFLPLSFFTSYFGQNVSEITGDDGNPTSWELWKVGTPITVVIIFFALLIAYRIMYPKSRLWFWKHRSIHLNALRPTRTSTEDIEMGTR